MEGLIKCSIVPPMNLYHTVLPYRSNNKLLFCLCSPCVFERNISGDCEHLREDERALTGTWVIDEIRLAVETFIESSISTSCTNTKLPSTVVKLKADASGYLTWFRSPVDEERYIHSFRECEGIEVDKASLTFNVAKRGLQTMPKLNLGQTD